MIREIIAALMLVGLLVASIIGTGCIERKSEELSDSLISAKEEFSEGQVDQAAELVRTTQKLWQDWESFAHIMLRHGEEIGELNREFYELLEKLEKNEASSATFDLLISRLQGMADTVRITPGAVF